MKRIILLVCLILVFVFTALSIAYLTSPSLITVNLDNLQTVEEKKARLFIKESWGKSAGRFGITKGGWLPGPMSLAADEQDNLYILDQENRRIQKFSEKGKLEKIISLDSEVYEDIAVDEGFIYLLDSVESRSVKKINQNGKVIRIYKIAKSIEPVSGLFLANDQVYVEVEHSKIFRVGTVTATFKNADNQVKTKSEGRPADEGFKTEAKLDNKGQVTASISGRYPLDSIKITGRSNVYQIISFDSDAAKNIYLTLNIARNDSDFNKQKDKLLGLVVDSEGKLSAKFYASNQYYTSHFRKFTVSPSGTIYQLLTTPQGVEVWKWQ